MFKRQEGGFSAPVNHDAVQTRELDDYMNKMLEDAKQTDGIDPSFAARLHTGVTGLMSIVSDLEARVIELEKRENR